MVITTILLALCKEAVLHDFSSTFQFFASSFIFLQVQQYGYRSISLITNLGLYKY